MAAVTAMTPDEDYEKADVLIDHTISKNDPAGQILKTLLRAARRLERAQGKDGVKDVDWTPTLQAQRKLAQIAAREVWLLWGMWGLLLLGVGFIAGWLAHSPYWGDWPLAAMPTCKDGVCWLAFRVPG